MHFSHMLAGLVWSGFRPSDDPSQLAYPIAANMYAAAGLERALELNRQVQLSRVLTALRHVDAGERQWWGSTLQWHFRGCWQTGNSYSACMLHTDLASS